VLAGDDRARRALEPLAWRLVVDANVDAPDAPTARTIAHAALALASPLSSPESTRSTEEAQWRPPAVRALRRALALDSADVWSAEQLEHITPYPYIWIAPQDELAQLRALKRLRARIGSSLTIALVGLELEVGSADSAAVLLSRAEELDLHGAALAHLRAELAFERGDTASGFHAYYAGADQASDAADLRPYRQDLAWVALPAELSQWDSLGLKGGSRASWLRAFWGRRELADGQLPGSRLPEHFRRWRIALRGYRWDSDGSVAMGIPDVGFAVEQPTNGASSGRELLPGPHNPDDAVNRWRALSRVLDDRGALLMRHGDPVHFPPVTGIGFVTEEHLGWNTADGLLIVGFSRIRIGSTRFGMVARNRPVGDYSASCHLDGRLCPHGGFLATEEFIRERQTAEHSDNNVRVFADSLGAIVQAYGIPNGGMLIVVAVPASHLVPDDSARVRTRLFQAAFRLVVGDSATGSMTYANDTTRTWRVSAPIGHDAWLTGLFEIPAPVGRWTSSVVASDAANRIGTGVKFGNIIVPVFSGTRLQLSDPILGRENGNLSWNHDGDAIPLNPTNAWRRDEPVIMTFEADGLVPGRRYDERLELWKIDPKHPDAKASSPALRIQHSETPSRIRQLIQWELSVRQLMPGDYRLVITMRDSVTGAESVQSRRLAVRP